ncbi:LysR family transcriptional regulator (plasmid) [Roseibium aggregatum]|uniref:LysR family transcriptional regulator n=1 Tax=Roseibium aggregatum TaxID=187304 RepID=UPI001E5123CC|nr:LysR family transcriptional regulator [Roseibium aggregatum]UES59704.1 LysR family transcriptional regulator [Roseibium aggregatum]
MNERDELQNRLLLNAQLLHAIAEEGNFSRAAVAVGLEQSAVSHRIKSLEAALGIRLFERTTRRIVPTEAGRIVCDAAQRCQEIWGSALSRIADVKTSRTIRLSVSSSVAMKWIVPALQRAQEAGLDLVVDVEDRLVDLHAGEAQAAIRYGTGPYPGFHAEALMTAQLVPVARPGLLKGQMVPGKGTSALLADRSGGTDGTGFSWTDYFTGCNWPEPPSRPVASFARADLAIQAAISGMGVALGRTLLIENDIEAGFLEVVGKPVASKAKYWLVTTAAYADTEGYRDLRAWIGSEIEIARDQNRGLLAVQP